MDSLTSLSQGIFVFPNGLQGGTPNVRSSKFRIPKTSFDSEIKVERWDEEFEHMWSAISLQIEDFQNQRNQSSLTELLEFVEKSYAPDGTQPNAVGGATYLPVGALLTGINKPDHSQYFKTFADIMTARNSGQVVVLPARDCSTMKSTIEALVSSIISSKYNFKDDDDEIEEDEDECDSDEEMPDPEIKLKRSQYTMDVLTAWYTNKYPAAAADPKPKIAIIIPNFEECHPRIIQDLIQILSNRCNPLPIVLILGVATATKTIFQTLSAAETTRIKIRVFTSQPATTTLNTITADILLTPKLPFHLSGYILRNMMDVYICYDFTITEFMKSFKYCLLEHYSQGNEYSLCTTSYARSLQRITQLTTEDLDHLRRLPSFRTHIEAILEHDPRRVVQLLTDDAYLRVEMKRFIGDIFSYMLLFHCFIRVLLVLVKDLPQAPLGKLLRSLYVECFNQKENVVDTKAFNECWRIMENVAKDQLISIMQNDVVRTIDEFLNEYCPDSNDDPIIEGVRSTIQDAQEEILNTSIALCSAQATSSSTAGELINLKSRDGMRQQLLEMAQKTKRETNVVTKKLLDYLKDNVIGKYVLSFCKGPPFIELFVFSKSELLRAHVIAAPRGAIDTALTNPRAYLECSCCRIENASQIVSTMPEISIAHKLLMESGQQVNLYDWLQAFWSVQDDSGEDSDEVPPIIQAKFARARAELEFLGYIKSSRKKTDHVTRLVW